MGVGFRGGVCCSLKCAKQKGGRFCGMVGELFLCVGRPIRPLVEVDRWMLYWKGDMLGRYSGDFRA